MFDIPYTLNDLIKPWKDWINKSYIYLFIFYLGKSQGEHILLFICVSDHLECGISET